MGEQRGTQKNIFSFKLSACIKPLCLKQNLSLNLGGDSQHIHVPCSLNCDNDQNACAILDKWKNSVWESF